MNENVILQDALTNPQFDALTIEVADTVEGDSQVVAQEALEAVLDQVLGISGEDWTIKPVHASVPGAYDLLPPPGMEIEVSQAFDLKYALDKHPQLLRAGVLFETNLDNYPEVEPQAEGPLEPQGGDPLELEGLSVDWFTKLSELERNPLWCSHQIQAQEIWSLTEGEDIIVGHPDSGYIPHPELDDSRIRHDLERDFYDGDDNAQNPKDRGGNHGLSTASVIASGRNNQGVERFVVGVAPKAEIIPMRITKKGPPVFLFKSGPRRVRDAIYHAIDSGAHVISMSLGGIGDDSLHRAIQEAVDRNLIVVAAAGNGVPFVVWPALYDETIAVAASDVNRKPWIFSSHGNSVDITAPGHNVWRAYVNEEYRKVTKRRSGTSYATAVTAGVAALWLAFHGTALEIYKDAGVPLNTVFRRMLAESADPPPEGHGGNYGAGILNVKRLLEMPLPQLDSFAVDPLQEIEAPPAEFGAVNTIASVFDTMPQDEVRDRLNVLVDVPVEELNSTLTGVEEELLFHMVTNPALRAAMVSSPAAADEEVGIESEAPGTPDGLSAVPDLSDTLRGRLAG